ncbi:tetratricopeptide repeat protein [Cylindrospermopsis raciborskii G7]|uniref:tetratricopeptide repeat protein n=1 Tax=Cylindrospermopsis raciborskii TaxID=77022 RepID=UPI003EB97232
MVNDNDDIQILINKTERFLKVSRSDQAIKDIKGVLKDFEKVLETDPDNLHILKVYAECLVKLHELRKALEVFKKLMELSPINVSIMRNYASALFDNGESKEALNVLESALHIEPKNVKVLSTYSKILLRLTDYKKACEIFERSLQIEPDNTIALNSYGKALADSGDYKKACEIFERSLQINPDNTITLNSYRKALADSGDYKKACEIFERSLQIEPDNIIALNSYRKALADSGDYKKACEIFERSLQINPDNTIALNSYGKALADSGDYKKACEIFERSLQINPDDTITLNTYGKALADSGDYKKACEIFQRSLQINPDDTIALTSYGKALADSGDYKKACEIFERSLQINPDNIIALTSCGKALADSGDYKKACEILQRSLQIQPDNYIFFIFAKCLEQLGRYKDAITQIEQIDTRKLKQYDVNVIHITLGRLYYCLKLYQKGDSYFNLAIDKSDDKEKSILSSARSILANNPHNENAVKMLRQITEDSPRYGEAWEMLRLNTSQKEYFEMVHPDYDHALNDAQILNRSIYHKIANEISILKAIAYRILRACKDENEVLTSIIASIEDVLEQINSRRAAEKSELEFFSTDETIANTNNKYQHILEVVAKTAHDISDFVNNELAIIESKTRRMIKKTPYEDPQYIQFNKLLIQLELSQAALNDLKAINEGIKLKKHHFPVRKLFEKWESNTQIDNACITLNIQNGDSYFNGDEEKIKSVINELVENSIKHNSQKADLQIQIISRDTVNPSGIRGARIPGSQKYLFIEFNDNGQGISPSRKDWIFQPMKTTATEGYGSGLGLFIIRKTLIQMNGYIQETGQKGATFEIYIPYTEEP